MLKYNKKWYILHLQLIYNFERSSASYDCVEVLTRVFSFDSLKKEKTKLLKHTIKILERKEIKVNIYILKTRQILHFRIVDQLINFFI